MTRVTSKIGPVAFLIAAVIATVAWAAFPAVASASPLYPTGTVGIDVSWPNCSAAAPSQPHYGIVGVNDGLGYSHNPCLVTEAAWFPSINLYANTGWDDQSTHVNPNYPQMCAPGDNNCLAYNYGYNAGIYAFNYANNHNIHATTWWLDVETDNTWNTDVVQNRNSLRGERAALLASGVTTVGVYSTTAQWQSITGGWINNWKNWGATAVTTAKQALTYCTGHQFTGGPTYFVQFLPPGLPLDRDVAC